MSSTARDESRSYREPSGSGEPSTVSRIVPDLSEEQLRRLPSTAEALVYKRCRDSLGLSTLVIFSPASWIRVSPHGTPRDAWRNRLHLIRRDEGDFCY